MQKQSVLNSDSVHRQRFCWRSTHAQVRVFVVNLVLDGFLISAGARTQSVIAQSSREAEYIAATAATSEAKYIQALFLACGQHVNTHLRSDSSLAPSLWQAEGVCHGYVLWTCDFCGCRRETASR